MDHILIEPLMLLARQAGAIAMKYRGKIEPVYKVDNSPLTIADIEANAIIIEGLQKLTPSIPVIAEENPKENNQEILTQTKTFWVVDSLDGTATYVEGFDGFSVNIGLIVNGVPEVGIIFFPAKEMIFFTGNNKKAYQSVGDDKPVEIKVLEPPKNGQLKIASRFDGKFPDFLSDATDGYQAELFPEAGQFRTMMVANGTTNIAIGGKGFQIWDTGPSYAILKSAGGKLVDRLGRSIRYDQGMLTVPEYVAGGTSALKQLRLIRPSGRRRSLENGSAITLG